MQIVLLNGLNGTARELAPLAEHLPGSVALDLPGHGGRAMAPEFTVPAIAADLIAQMDALGITQAHVVGYSFGGYVALYMAKHYASRVSGVSTIATAYVFDNRYVLRTERLVRNLTEQKKIKAARRAYLQQMHGNDWLALSQQHIQITKALQQQPALSEADLKSISVPTTVITTKDDPVVTLEETAALVALIPGATSVVFPGQAHPLSELALADVAAEINKHV